MDLTIEYTHDGKEIDASFFDILARECGSVRDFDDFRAEVGARVVRWTVYTDKHGTRDFGTFAEFARFLSIEKITYIWTYDGVNDFAFFDWAMLENGYKRDEKDDHVTEDGRYKKVTENAFVELSGDAGQRYSYTMWTRAKRTRAEGGDRHERTHGTDFYAFKNFFSRGFEECGRALGVDVSKYENRAHALRDIVTAFDGACLSLTGSPFLGKKKPLAMTAGGLAKRELLRHLYGSDDAGVNARAFRKAHPLTERQDVFFRDRYLNRGGICYANPLFVGGAILDTLNKYDVSSEYSSVAREMPDLGKVEMCDARELFEPLEGFEYIAVFDELHAVVKKGMPALWQHPVNGTHPKTFNVYVEYAIFWREVVALRSFYNFHECNIKYALRVKKGENSGYRAFTDKYYGVKENARNSGNFALGEFGKIMLNSAWGKLSQRTDFPVVQHVYDENLGAFRVSRIYDPKAHEEPTDKDARGLSIVQGAYVTMGGRLRLMDYILRTCGTRDVASTLYYTDTDSITTTRTAPEEIVGASKIGLLKLENVYTSARFVGKKAYYGASRDGVEIHVRGLPASAIIERVKEEYGADDVLEIPVDAWYYAFNDGIQYVVPILANVKGGRARLYIRRTITDAQRGQTTDGRKFSRDGGLLVEI